MPERGAQSQQAPRGGALGASPLAVGYFPVTPLEHTCPSSAGDLPERRYGMPASAGSIELPGLPETKLSFALPAPLRERPVSQWYSTPSPRRPRRKPSSPPLRCGMTLRGSLAFRALLSGSRGYARRLRKGSSSLPSSSGALFLLRSRRAWIRCGGGTPAGSTVFCILRRRPPSDKCSVCQLHSGHRRENSPAPRSR